MTNCASQNKYGVAVPCASLRSILGHKRSRKMGQDNDMALVAAESLYRRYKEGKIENLNSTRLIIWLVDVRQDNMTGWKKQLRS